MIVYYVAMTFAVLFVPSAGFEAASVLAKGPSWKALWTVTGSLFCALICFVIGISFYS